ncbi:hypothetical protein BDZ97DRAFT_1683740 [Flammula alnicola]|nr:hypothetical protein BDZ97DRAFT_1683740 [Flammula alnicola]
MPKPAPFTPKPTIEKLPLAARKDVRDNFESKKSDYESTIAGLLGFPVTINIDVNAVWAYGEALAATQAGGTFSGYVDGFIDALTKYVGTYGDLGKEYFKNAITKSEFTVTVNELGDRAETISADVKDGVFRIRFKHDCLGYNASWFDIHQIVEAIEGTPHEGFGLRAKHSIEDEYKANIEEVSEQIAKILNLPDLILDPNFEENYAALLKKTDQDWQRTFGSSTLEYFRCVDLHAANDTMISG